MNLQDKKIGIIVNEKYYPSVEAGHYINRVLKKININNYYLSLKDVIENNVDSDLIFNVYYGEFGDGGFLSGILEQKGIKFVGNNQNTCVLMWNKILSKMIFQREGFNTPSYWYSFNDFKKVDQLYDDITNRLSLPIIVKPTCGAASEGIVLLEDVDRLKKFLENNLNYINSGYYFLEEFIEGVEISAGYIKAIDKELPIAEISIKNHKFQDNTVKFKSGLKENIIPARLPKGLSKHIQKIILKLSREFNVRCFCRADMIYNKDNNKVYILEINTNPGLLPTSLLPSMVKKFGLSEEDFFKSLIESSL